MGAGDFVFLHQLFGENLAGFNLGGIPARPKDGHAGFMKNIRDTRCQRCLRADHGQVNFIVSGCFEQRFNVGWAYGQGMGLLCRAGVTRCGEKLFDFRALGQLPDQRVLPCPAPDDQYFDLAHLPDVRLLPLYG